MEVTVNTVPTMRVVCTPDHLVDLVVGRLYTEGIVGGLDDIEDIYVCDQGTRASVLLSCHHADFSRQGVETVPSCCTGNRVYNRYFTSDERPAKVKPIPWEAAWVFAAARAFAEDSPLHKATTGTHSCYLVLGGTVTICREDLGRHNAFDKVVGGRFARGHRFAGRADLLKRSFAGGHGHEGHPCRRSDFGHQGGAHRRDHSPRP